MTKYIDHRNRTIINTKYPTNPYLLSSQSIINNNVLFQAENIASTLGTLPELDSPDWPQSAITALNQLYNLQVSRVITFPLCLQIATHADITPDQLVTLIKTQPEALHDEQFLFAQALIEHSETTTDHLLEAYIHICRTNGSLKALKLLDDILTENTPSLESLRSITEHNSGQATPGDVEKKLPTNILDPEIVAQSLNTYFTTSTGLLTLVNKASDMDFKVRLSVLLAQQCTEENDRTAFDSLPDNIRIAAFRKLLIGAISIHPQRTALEPNLPRGKDASKIIAFLYMSSRV